MNTNTMKQLLTTLTRTTPRRLTSRTTTTTRRPFSALQTQKEIQAENNAAREALEAEKSSVQKYVESTRELDPTMVWGTTVAPPPPSLPDDPSEIAALDPSHAKQDPVTLSGGTRVVQIRQEKMKISQSPSNHEQTWIISFQEDGEPGQCWDNSLMGWVSSADPMANNMRLQMSFRNAQDAVYFAKKRGWDYVVEKPIVRKGRSDDAQYQDNFLSQAVSRRVRAEKKACDQWFRSEAGTSHYFRPLKYHGDGLVVQHGPNGGADIAKAPEGYYKMR